MINFWSIIALVVEKIAVFGAGAASSGVNCEPEVPEELRK